MAAEVTLKEESALEIGKSLANSFQGLQAVGADTANNALELEEEREQTSYLEKISGGIKKMVVFFGGLAASIKEARRERLITEAQGTEEEKEELKKDKDRDLFSGFKDKIKKLTDGFKNTIMPVFGIFKGLLGKAALFGLLLAFALNLDKFSDDLKPIVKKIVDGFKAAFTSLKEDFFPVVENFIKLVGSAFDSVSKILAIFEGDFSTFFEGLGGLGDVALRIISVIGDAFLSLVDAALKFFGVESELVQSLKMMFRKLPETIKNAITGFFNFFSKTLPNAFSEAITNLKTELKKDVEFIKDRFIQIFTDIRDAFLKPFKLIRDKVKDFFGFSTDTVTNGDSEAVAQSNAITENQTKSEALMAERDKLLEQGPKNASASAENSFKFQVKKLNAAIIREEGRDNDHKKVNSTSPIDYAMADSAGKIESFVQEKINPSIVGEADKLPETYNTPVIEPNEFMNNGGQLNKDSQEFASTPPSVNMNMIKGGDNNTISSNQTHTNISETTTTSDVNAKKIFKTA